MGKMVVDKVVREEAGGEEEEAPGIQNQKQEPHTKLWGKKNPKNTAHTYYTSMFLSMVCTGYI